MFVNIIIKQNILSLDFLKFILEQQSFTSVGESSVFLACLLIFFDIRTKIFV